MAGENAGEEEREGMQNNCSYILKTLGPVYPSREKRAFILCVSHESFGVGSLE